MFKRYLTLVVVMVSLVSYAQEQELLPLGDMEQWLTREVKESGIIGGNSRTLYEIAPQRTLEENEAYVPDGSIWATSSVYARVKRINKGSITVFPEEREEGGTAARLECRTENVKVLGIINISAMATGTIFTGSMVEPIKDTKDPQAKINSGVPFTKRPEALSFDYKLQLLGQRIYDEGVGSSRIVPGRNAAEVVIILQHRWEDGDGNIFAKRVATGCEMLTQSFDNWQDNHTVEILYGDMSHNKSTHSYMDLITSEPIYAMNSRGEMKPIQEVGWADSATEPTHLFIRFSASYGGAYIGAEGTTLWLDNVSLIY
ncbi:MAG: PCMD domain-containing protein [Rikenellaceae bacterium]